MALRMVPFRFADLLPELRDHVYDLYYADAESPGSLIDVMDLTQQRPSTALALTCRQIRAETHVRWQAADISFWHHRFWLSKYHLPSTEVDTYRLYRLGTAKETGLPPLEPEPPTRQTVLGDFNTTDYGISNITPLGHLAQRLHRLYLGQPSDKCGTTVLIWEALDQGRTKQCADWNPHSRVNFATKANKIYTRRTYCIAVASQQDMLQDLTGYLQRERQEAPVGFECGSGRASRRARQNAREIEKDDSKYGDVFMLEGSRG
ncbi:hypothetical protein LTR95_006638 [Oleoguttula sp. CCFEE 5521]